MKILFINKTAPFDGGGAEDVIWQIGKRLAKRGDEIHYFCPSPTTNPPEVSENVHFHFVSTPSGFMTNRVLFFIKGLGYYPGVYRDIKPDIVLDNASPFPFLIAYGYGDAPVVTKIHTIYRSLAFECKPNLLVKIGTVLGEELYRFRNGDNIICVSESTRSRVQNLIRTNPEDVHVVENSVNLSEFDYDFRPDSNVILSLATQRPQKGLRYLLQAWPIIKNCHPDVVLKMAGSGPEHDNLSSLATELNLDDVEFLGFVSPDRKRKLMRNAYAYVLPSIIEGHPLSLMEAIASGCPVVSTDTWGVRDVITHDKTGLLAAPKDPESFATQVNRILSNRNLGERLAETAFDSIDIHSWEEAADQERSILERIADT